MEYPRGSFVAPRHTPVVTHVARSRQLPTNQHHASLSASGRVTREYQVDSPSQYAWLPGLGRSRDGPSARAGRNDKKRDLTGSSISGACPTLALHLCAAVESCIYVGTSEEAA